MKLTLPLEYRIQKKGEYHDDEELIRDAMEVHSLKIDLEMYRKANRGLGIALMVAIVIIGAFAVCRWVLCL